MDNHTHHHACECREKQFREALADAIRRPMGVIPDSATEFLKEGDLERAEERRPKMRYIIADADQSLEF